MFILRYVWDGGRWGDKRREEKIRGGQCANFYYIPTIFFSLLFSPLPLPPSTSLRTNIELRTWGVWVCSPLPSPPTQVYSNPFVYPNILSPNSLHTKQNIGLRTWCLGYFIFCLINMILKHHIQTPIHLHLCTLCLKKYFNNSKRVEFSV